MSFDSVRLHSSKKLVIASLLLLLAGVFVYFNTYISGVESRLAEVGAFFQAVLLPLFPILMFSALSGERKLTRLYSKRYSPFVRIITRLLIASTAFVALSWLFGLFKNSVLQNVPPVIQGLITLAVSYTSYGFVELLTVLLYFFTSKSALSRNLSAMSVALGVVFAITKLISATVDFLSIITTVPNLGESQAFLLIAGIFAVAFYASAFVLFLCSNRSSSLAAALEEDDEQHKNSEAALLKSLDSVEERKRLYGMDEDDELYLKSLDTEDESEQALSDEESEASEQ